MVDQLGFEKKEKKLGVLIWGQIWWEEELMKGKRGRMGDGEEIRSSGAQGIAGERSKTEGKWKKSEEI